MKQKSLLSDFCFTLVDDISVGEIVSKISSKAAGDDGFNITFIELCCLYILPIVTHIVNYCLENSVFPKSMENCHGKPFPKTNEANEFKDLRPISVLPVLSKISEKIIEIQLRDHINSKKIISPYQSGFRPQHSCLTALLNISDSIMLSTDKGQETINLLSNYLTGRRQRVVINSEFSHILEVSSGVPQGSILGPLLYSIYICNYFSYIIYCKCHFYADGHSAILFI